MVFILSRVVSEIERRRISQRLNISRFLLDTKQKTNSKSGAETQVGKIIKLGHWIPYQVSLNFLIKGKVIVGACTGNNNCSQWKRRLKTNI